MDERAVEASVAAVAQHHDTEETNEENNDNDDDDNDDDDETQPWVLYRGASSERVHHQVTHVRFHRKVTRKFKKVLTYHDHLLAVDMGNCKALKEIPAHAFFGCYSLRQVQLPKKRLEKIGSYAFSVCFDLEELHLPESVKVIGKKAFSNCKNLQRINIPSGVTKIEWSTFEKCIRLQSIELPTTLVEISKWAFLDCESLESIDIPDSCTSIGECAFQRCGRLQSASLPRRLQTLGHSAFGGCNSLSRLSNFSSLPALTEIHKFTFSSCKSLITTNLACSNITRIGPDAFRNCSNLKTFHLPANIQQMGEYVFYGCTSLQTIHVPTGPSFCNHWTFVNQSKLELPPGGIRTKEESMALDERMEPIVLLNRSSHQSLKGSADAMDDDDKSNFQVSFWNAINILANVSDNLTAVYFLLSANPELLKGACTEG